MIEEIYCEPCGYNEVTQFKLTLRYTGEELKEMFGEPGPEYGKCFIEQLTNGYKAKVLKLPVMEINGNGIKFYGPNHSIKTMLVDDNLTLEKKGIDNMNKILELYDERKRHIIEKKYAEIVDKEYSQLDVVKKYEELVNNFAIELEQLANSVNINGEELIVQTGYSNDYKYELSYDLKYNVEKQYIGDKNAELLEHERLMQEVKAHLSLSDDKDYQIEVLTRFEIIDKKGKLTI